MAFQQAGLEWVHKGLSGFLSGADRGAGALGRVGNAAERVGPKFSILQGVVMGVASAITTALIGAVAKAGKAVVGLGQESVALSGQFQSMSTRMNIAAGAAGAVADQYGGLSEVALKVGGDTRLLGVSAVGAADAMTGLLKAGIPLEDVMGNLNNYMEDGAQLGGLLRASIDLAAATELNMVEASDLASVSMATYGLTTKETAGAMDFMVRAADASVASVSGLRDSMINVGATSAAFGFDLEETNTALALLSSRGIVGAEAGTALKSMFTNLMRTTPKVTDALEAHNIALYDGEGNMYSMIEIIGQFQTATENMSEAQRNQFIQTVAGTYGMKSMNTLLGEGVQGWEDMEVAIGNATGITQQASAMAATYGGQMESLQGNIETLKIRIGDALLPSFTDMLVLFSGFVTEVGPTVVEAFKRVGEKMLDITGYLKDLYDTYKDGGFAAVFNIPLAVTDALTFLKDTLLMLAHGDIKEGLKRVQYIIQETFGIDAAQKFAPFRRFLEEEIPNAVKIAQDALAVIKDLFGMGPEPTEMEEQRNRWVAVMGGVEVEKPADKLREIFAQIKDAFGVMVAFVDEHGEAIKNVILGIGAGFAAFSVLSVILPPLLEFAALLALILTSGGGIGSILIVAVGFISALVALLGGPLTIAIAVVSALIALFVANVGGIRDKVMPIFEAIASVWTESIMPALTIAIDAIKEAMGSSGDASVDWGKVLTIVVDNIVFAITTLGAIISGIMMAAAEVIKYFAESFQETEKIVKEVTDGFKEWFAGIKDVFAARSWSYLGNAIKKIFKGVGKIVLNFGKLIIQAFLKPFEVIHNAIKGFVKGVLKFFTSLKDKLVGHSIIPDMMNKMQKVIVAVLTAVGDFIEKVLNAIAKVFDTIFTGIARLTDVSMNDIYMTIEKVMAVIQKLWEIWTTSLSTAWDTLWGMAMSILDVAKDYIKSTISMLKSSVESIWNTFVDNVMVAWDELWASVIYSLSEAWASIMLVVQEGIASVLQFLLDSIQYFIDAGTNVANAIRDGISDAWVNVTTSIADGITKIYTTITGLAQKMLDAGKNIVDNIRVGITNAWDTVTLAFGKFIDGIKNSFASGGSLVMKLLLAGANLVSSIKVGLENAWYKITDAIGNLLDELGLSELWDRVTSAGGRIVDALIAGISSNWQRFVDWLKSAIQGIFGSSEPTNLQSPFRTDYMKPRGAEMMARFWKGAQGALPKLTMDMQASMSALQPNMVSLPPQVGDTDRSQHITVEVNPTYANMQSEAGIFYDVTAALQSAVM